MILDDVFKFLKAEGLTHTHATFSTDYLGHSARYYDYLRCSAAAPSLRSLLKLAMLLNDIAHGGSAELNDIAAGELTKRIMSQALTHCR